MPGRGSARRQRVSGRGGVVDGRTVPHHHRPRRYRKKHETGEGCDGHAEQRDEEKDRLVGNASRPIDSARPVHTSDGEDNDTLDAHPDHRKEDPRLGPDPARPQLRTTTPKPAPTHIMIVTKSTTANIPTGVAPSEEASCEDSIKYTSRTSSSIATNATDTHRCDQFDRRASTSPVAILPPRRALVAASLLETGQLLCAGDGRNQSRRLPVEHSATDADRG